jgi:hypothetical protein
LSSISGRRCEGEAMQASNNIALARNLRRFAPHLFEQK